MQDNLEMRDHLVAWQAAVSSDPTAVPLSSEFGTDKTVRARYI